MSDSKPQHDPSMDDILASIRKIISDDEARAASGPGADAAAEALAPLPPLGPTLQRPPSSASPMGIGTAATAAAEDAPADDDVLLLTQLVDEPPGAAASKVTAPAPTLVKPAAQSTPSITAIPSPSKSRVIGIDAPQPAAAVLPQPTVAPPSPATVSPPVISPPYPPASDMSATLPPSSGSKVSGSFERLDRAVRAAGPAATTPTQPLLGATGSKTVEELVRELLQEWMDRNLPAVVEKVIEREIERMSRRGVLGPPAVPNEKRPPG
jgi:cell pole-organizing protein PopZ